MTGQASRFIIEPLDRLRHDRAAFSCGAPRVDNFLANTAAKHIDRDIARVFVLTEAENAPVPAPVLGFYAMNAHEVVYKSLLAGYAKRRPSHGAIPAALISMMGVDRPRQGEGIGECLMMDAIARIVRTADDIALSVIRIDVLDDGDETLMGRRRRLYERLGFQPLASNAWKLFMPIATARQIVGES